MNQQPTLFHRCVEIFRRQPGRFTAIAALPYATLHPALMLTLWLFITNTTGQSADLRAVWTAMTFADKIAFDFGFLLWITVPFAMAGLGLCRMASDQIANRTTSFRQSVQDMVVFIPSAFFLGALVGVAAFLGACFLIIPGFVAAAAFSLVVPAAAIERIRPLAALRRGISLVSRVFGRVLLLFFVYGFFIIAVVILQAILLSTTPHALPVRALILVLSQALPIVPLALLNICFTLLFLEARAHTSTVPLAVAT
jgi:hypothetical protein